MSHGYEQTSVSELREILRTQYCVTDEETLSQKKSALVDLLL